MANKPAIVLVHGAWHSSVHFANLTQNLNFAGYQVMAVDLPSVSILAVDDSLEKDAAVVKAAIKSFTCAGQNVVLMMHSYGGLAGCEGLTTFMEEQKTEPQPGRVVRLFFVSALILEPGVCAAGDNLDVPVVDVVDGLAYILEPYNRFYNATPAPVARKAMSILRPQVWNSFTTVAKSAAWRDYGLPVTFLVCERDRAIPAQTDAAKFLKRLENAEIEELDVLRIDSDHSPWVSAEDEFMKLTFDLLKRSELSN